MTRIHTKKSDLEAAVKHIRNLTGRDFFLQGAYGGWQLQEKVGEGCRDITTGYVSKREMLDRLRSMSIGMDIGARMCREAHAREQEKVYGQTLTSPFNGV
jgi:hypothetical protein